MWPRESGSVWAHWAPLLLGQRRADWRLFGARNKVLASGRFAMPSIGRCPKTLSAACYSITNRTSLRARARYDGDAPILLGWHYFQWESTEILHIKTGGINFNTQAAVPFFFVFVFFYQIYSMWATSQILATSWKDSCGHCVWKFLYGNLSDW